MQAAHADAYANEPRRYGLGLAIEHHSGRKVVSHGGGGYGCGSTFAMVPSEGLCVAALFNQLAGYGIPAREVFDHLLAGETVHKETTRGGEPPQLVGQYDTPWPGSEGLPDRIEIVERGGTLIAEYDGESHELEIGREGIYHSAGGVTLGFVPSGKYLVFDAFYLGLVSACPYKKRLP